MASATFPFASLIDQNIHIVPSFTLECETVLYDVPVAYKTWGKLNAAKDNVMIICHAFTGSSDVEDWWGPLMGPGKAFDPNRYFIFCANVMGSPYGSASPVTINPLTERQYGPDFPATTIRDDVLLHKIVLDRLQISSVAVVIGGSLGGMTVLEWPLCTPPGYVRHIIPIATSARHSAWCISWGEAQRQSIYSDPGYLNGYYDVQPSSGLAAARMTALLTYRSRNSFEARFGRKAQAQTNALLTPPESPPRTPSDPFTVHNDGCRNVGSRPQSSLSNSHPSPSLSPPPKPPVFSAQSYLRYQGDKFTARFDANCYIHLTRKLDSHDIARGRARCAASEAQAIQQVLSSLPPRTLVMGIQTDGLFTPNEQQEIASHIPDAQLIIIPSPEGHDGFLLEFELINQHLLNFLRLELPELYVGGEVITSAIEGFDIKKTSIFGEAEADIARW